MDILDLARSGGHQLATILMDTILRDCLDRRLSPEQTVTYYREQCYHSLCFVLRVYCFRPDGEAIPEPELQQAVLDSLQQPLAPATTMHQAFYDNNWYGVVTFTTTGMIYATTDQIYANLSTDLLQIERVMDCTIHILASSIAVGLGSADYMIRELQFAAPLLLKRDWHKPVNFYLLEAKRSPQDCTPQTELERQLVDSVLELNFTKANSLMNRLIDNEWNEPDLASGLRQRVSVRMNWTLIVLRLPRSSDDSLTLQIDKYIGDIQCASDMEHLKDIVRSFFSNLDEYYLSIRYNLSCHIDRIIEYIRSNYNNPDLCATMICDAFRLSSSYLSRMFKQKTGVKLIDYIHSLRLAEVKRLMQETNLTVAEIAKQTGYSSGGALTRSFHRYENMTPSEYRTSQKAQ